MKNIEKCPECGWTYKKETFFDEGWEYARHVCSNPDCSFVFNTLTCSCGKAVHRHSVYSVGISLRCPYCDKGIPFRIKSELFKNRNTRKKENKMTEKTENKNKNMYLDIPTGNLVDENPITPKGTKENFVVILKNAIELNKKGQKLIELGFDTDSEIIQNIEFSTDAICDILCNLYGIDIEFFVEWFLSDKKKASKRSGKTKYILLDTPEQFYDFAIINKPTLMEYGVI